MIAETAACELAAIRGSVADLGKIREGYRQTELVADDGDAYGAADVKFYNAIFIASHNELLKKMGATIRMALCSTQRITRHLLPSVALPLHKAVSDAICRRDGRGARIAVRALVLEAGKTLYGVLHPDHPEGWKTMESDAPILEEQQLENINSE